jgi:hypothetical protein
VFLGFIISTFLHEDSFGEQFHDIPKRTFFTFARSNRTKTGSPKSAWWTRGVAPQNNWSEGTWQMAVEGSSTRTLKSNESTLQTGAIFHLPPSTWTTTPFLFGTQVSVIDEGKVEIPFCFCFNLPSPIT